MRLRAEALVIRERRLDEFDRLLTLLTAKQGVITAYAKNAGKLKGSMVSSTELLCYSSFIIFQNRDRSYIDSAESNTVFFGIRGDVEKLSLATYFCQLCAELIPELDAGGDYLRLALNTLYALEKDKLDRGVLKALFELRLLAMSGYMPDLVVCAACGAQCGGGAVFSPVSGTVLCPGCATTAGNGLIPLSAGVFAAMRHIVYSDFERLFVFRLAEPSASELSRVCEAYVLCQVERMLPALTFYKSICGGNK